MSRWGNRRSRLSRMCGTPPTGDVRSQDLPNSCNSVGSLIDSRASPGNHRPVRRRARRNGRDSGVDRRARHPRRPPDELRTVAEVAYKVIEQQYNEFKSERSRRRRRNNAPRPTSARCDTTATNISSSRTRTSLTSFMERERTKRRRQFEEARSDRQVFRRRIQSSRG